MISWTQKGFDDNLMLVCTRCHSALTEEYLVFSVHRAFSIIALELPLLNRAAAVCQTWSTAAKMCLTQLSQLKFQLWHEPIHELDARILWRNRYYWVGHPRWLMHLLRVVDLQDKEVDTEVELLLSSTHQKVSCVAALCCEQGGRSCDPDLSAIEVMQLFKKNVPSRSGIRRVGAEKLRALYFVKNQSMVEYIPMLVNNLRLEAEPNLSPLLTVLIDVALHDPNFRFDFYWALVLTAEAPESSDRWRYTQCKDRLLKRIGLSAFTDFESLYTVYQAFHAIQKFSSVEDVRALLQEKLKGYQDISLPCVFDPTKRMKGNV